MKKILFFLTVCFFSFNLFCQETESESFSDITEISNDDTELSTADGTEKSNFLLFGSALKKPETALEFINSLDFSFRLPVSLYMNTGNTKNSAPSPIVFTPGIGVQWPNYTFLSTEPSLSFYPGYYLWYDGQALPAEIENRTTTAWTFIFDLPVVVSFFFPGYKFQLTGGVMSLLRFGGLSAGVNPADSGFSGSAASDNRLINKYFWEKGRFLYLSTSFSCLFSFYKNSKAGPFIAVYMPVGGIFAGDGMNGIIITAGIKAAF